ncbi:hypothetical protein PoB_000436100 [Plakobranchus ocellatus]|uniref:Uncharacterized protein n=1 Tax=Plakobranchus ocellatus TaxID=259542 RepID=A0AAV3XQ89_9GAST|nr:hypothetical protein PoB_000436100 [Plakobranchus ocellatus]
MVSSCGGSKVGVIGFGDIQESSVELNYRISQPRQEPKAEHKLFSPDSGWGPASCHKSRHSGRLFFPTETIAKVWTCSDPNEMSNEWSSVLRSALFWNNWKTLHH